MPEDLSVPGLLSGSLKGLWGAPWVGGRLRMMGGNGVRRGWGRESPPWRGTVCVPPFALSALPTRPGPVWGPLGSASLGSMASSWFGPWEAGQEACGGGEGSQVALLGSCPLGPLRVSVSVQQPLHDLCAQVLEGTPSSHSSGSPGSCAAFSMLGPWPGLSTQAWGLLTCSALYTLPRPLQDP